MNARSILTVRAADRPGLVAVVSGAVHEAGFNIRSADQHTDAGEQVFVQRLDIEGGDPDDLTARLRDRGAGLGLDWTLHSGAERPRVAIMVSREAHCLVDLLGRQAAGELAGEVVGVVANHPDHADLCRHFGVPYRHLPVDDRRRQERQVAATLDEWGADLVVLARYMQVLGPELVAEYRDRMINIHHSFLPAFSGARPYHQAHARGVKLIGATAHYVTDDLDEGPIIAQATVEVGHRDEVTDLTQRGRDVEKVVLARAVRLHLERRVVVVGARTVVFG